MPDNDRKAEATKAVQPEGIPEAAKRALAEAEARREEARIKAEAKPKEINGRNGPDPARYGDWEKKGIAIDF